MTSNVVRPTDWLIPMTMPNAKLHAKRRGDNPHEAVAAAAAAPYSEGTHELTRESAHQHRMR